MFIKNELIANQTIMVFISSMVGSSCCLIQLIFNLLSWPCAGFAIFDRFRPFFEIVLFFQTIYTMFKIPGISKEQKSSLKFVYILKKSSKTKGIHNLWNCMVGFFLTYFCCFGQSNWNFFRCKETHKFKL